MALLAAHSTDNHLLEKQKTAGKSQFYYSLIFCQFYFDYLYRFGALLVEIISCIS